MFKNDYYKNKLDIPNVDYKNYGGYSETASNRDNKKMNKNM